MKSKKDKNWQISEALAVDIYGKRVSASGSGLDKLDIQGEGRFAGLLIENKYTDKASYSLNIKTLRKAKAQAAAEGKKFLIRLDFGQDRVYIVQEETDFIDSYPEDVQT